MQCKRIGASADELKDPFGQAWTGIAPETLEMAATPLANQPSGYIKASRDEKQIGKVRALNVQQVHNGTEIFIRLSWADESQDLTVTDTNQFPDACGILMPVAGGDPVIEEMGSQQAPVNAWFWRANFEPEVAYSQTASGLGSTVQHAATTLKANASFQQGNWAVVFHRQLAEPEHKTEAVQLAPGAAVKIAFAVWEGSNGERAGVKSFSKEWREMALEA